MTETNKTTVIAGRAKSEQKSEAVSVAGEYASSRSAPANRLPGEADFHDDPVPF
jgi:hypothetical protein